MVRLQGAECRLHALGVPLHVEAHAPAVLARLAQRSAHVLQALRAVLRVPRRELDRRGRAKWRVAWKCDLKYVAEMVLQCNTV